MSKQVAVVLGVGPGLGAAVARRFAREGMAVGLLARGEDKLAPVQADIEREGGTALSVPCDAGDAGSVARAFSRVQKQLGDAQVFIYNAGAFQMGGVLDLSPEQFERCWRANCLGAFLGAQQVLPAMLARGAGTILLTGATASLRGSARFSGLAVGKFGLRALGQSMARELGQKGIHVAHIIIDGAIGTAIPGATERDETTLLAPDAIADTYWQLHRQDVTAWTHEMDLRPAVERF